MDGWMELWPGGDMSIFFFLSFYLYLLPIFAVVLFYLFASTYPSER